MTKAQAMDLIRTALRQCKDAQIEDVTMDESEEGGNVILTTDDGDKRNTWVLLIEETDLPG